MEVRNMGTPPPNRQTPEAQPLTPLGPIGPKAIRAAHPGAPIGPAIFSVFPLCHLPFAINDAIRSSMFECHQMSPNVTFLSPIVTFENCSQQADDEHLPTKCSFQMSPKNVYGDVW
jgi:hypothetical protein